MVAKQAMKENLQCTSKYGHLRISQDICHVQVRGVMLCGGNKLRKRQEMRLIFKLGTSQPHGLRWLERVLVFFDALYLGVKIFRLELANHNQILLQNNGNNKVSIFGRFLKKFVAMATQLGFEV